MSGRPAYQGAVVIYDRAYRWIHRLDRPEAAVGPVLRIEIRRCRRARTLPDGTRLSFGDRVGIVHLDNSRIAALHVDAPSPLSVGLQFRRQVVLSLRALAALAGGGRPLSDVRAFAATTIFHPGLARLGFTADPGRPAWRRLVAAYQRALLGAINPASRLRQNRATYREARRLWLSRQALLARYGRRSGVTRVLGA